MKLEYLKVNLDVLRNVGSDAAILFALMKYGKFPIDGSGYFALDASYVSRITHWNRCHFYRVRSKLVNAGYINVFQGVNQNNKPKYKLLK